MIYLHPASPLHSSRDYWHDSFGILANARQTIGRGKIVGKWAMDNDAFSAWDAYRFIKALENYRDLPNCLFVVAPDVVGNHEKTLHRFHIWKSVIQEYGFPIAFVAQNGLTSVDDLPLDEFTALFIGGDTQFKLSAFIAETVKTVKARGKWVHMGRVNTLRRIRYAVAIGCDSCDGSIIRFDQQIITKFPAYLENKQERLWDSF